MQEVFFQRKEKHFCHFCPKQDHENWTDQRKVLTARLLEVLGCLSLNNFSGHPQYICCLSPSMPKVPRKKTHSNALRVQIHISSCLWIWYSYTSAMQSRPISHRPELIKINNCLNLSQLSSFYVVSIHCHWIFEHTNAAFMILFLKNELSRDFPVSGWYLGVHQCQNQCRVLEGAGSQSVVSAYQHTLAG